MMKKLLILFIISAFYKTASAQKELVTLDEHNKYIYYQVVDMPGVTADTLYHRVLAGIKSSKVYKSTKAEFTSNRSITIRSKFLLYSSQAMARHEAGDLAYTMVIEFKDGKYRYWLTDFEFSPYERTRYGVYAKKPGDGYALEDGKAKQDVKVFGSYLEQIAKAGKQTGEQLTLFTATPQKKATQPAKTDTRKW